MNNDNPLVQKQALTKKGHKQKDTCEVESTETGFKEVPGGEDIKGSLSFVPTYEDEKGGRRLLRDLSHELPRERERERET